MIFLTVKAHFFLFLVRGNEDKWYEDVEYTDEFEIDHEIPSMARRLAEDLPSLPHPLLGRAIPAQVEELPSLPHPLGHSIHEIPQVQLEDCEDSTACEHYKRTSVGWKLLCTHESILDDCPVFCNRCDLDRNALTCRKMVSEYGELYWPETKSGSHAHLPCKRGFSGYMTRFCLSGRWTVEQLECEPCKDEDDWWKDSAGFYCANWVGDNCWRAVEDWYKYNYTQEDEDEILDKCQASCQSCGAYSRDKINLIDTSETSK